MELDPKEAAPALAAGVVLAEQQGNKAGVPAWDREKAQADYDAASERAAVKAPAAVSVKVEVETNKPTNERSHIMPRGDGTGPMGAGPMTGRALGNRAGVGGPGFVRGPGGGFGRGGGRGQRNRFYATGLPGWMRGGRGAVSPVGAPPTGTEKQWLENQAQALQTRLDEVRQRLSELGAEKK